VRRFPLAAVLLLSACSLFAQSEEKPWEQKEQNWVDDRWSKTDVGGFLAATLPVPGGVVKKGLSIRVGDAGEAAVGYDTARCNWRAGWTGGFLKFGAARYGLTNAPTPDGEIRFTAPDAGWTGGEARWRGLHVNSQRVVLEYTVGGTRVLEAPWFEKGRFSRGFDIAPHAGELRVGLLAKVSAAYGVAPGAGLILENGNASLVLEPSRETRSVVVAVDPAGVVTLTERVPEATIPITPRWQPLTTRGTLGTSADAYVVDTLTVPYGNPWKALMFISGVDFLPNGDAAVCTIHGDVWVVSGIDDKLATLTWRRFATGLFQPLGLRVVGGKILVLGRDQITRLHDENGDGEADFYENFCNLIDTSAGGHDFVTSLETDGAGQLYFVDPIGAHRVAADGSKIETIATGWRNPNGMGVNADASILTIAPQEGNWTPSSAICEVKPGGYYGFGGPRVTPERPLGYDAPLCWIPHSVDNSSGSQLWTPHGWGPLGGHMLHLSFGICRSFLVLREVVGGVAQGGVVPLKPRFLSGAMRGTFRPQDGQLYVVGARGWQTSGIRDGCLQRVRYTGKKIALPVALHAHANGLLIEFSEPLDRAAAEDTGSYGVQRWNYRYAASYGSKDWSIEKPDSQGRDEVEVKSVRLQPDGRSVFLEIPTIAPVMQMAVKYSLNTADGAAFTGDIFHTIHALGADAR
jgi:glucose/arabinose dehydrogenase